MTTRPATPLLQSIDLYAKRPAIEEGLRAALRDLDVKLHAAQAPTGGHNDTTPT